MDTVFFGSALLLRKYQRRGKHFATRNAAAENVNIVYV
jgi:hypothetical protein